MDGQEVGLNDRMRPSRQEFLDSLAENNSPPANWHGCVRALWLDAKGHWEAAHSASQESASAEFSRIHAYLHRKEGDLPNAAYWYHKAGASVFNGSLQKEWESLLDLHCRKEGK